MNTPKQTDILVIGCGLAGAIAAISATDEGKNVLIIAKYLLLKSGNTLNAQGEIVYTRETGSPAKLKQDIIKTGDDHCWEDAVDLICIEGPGLVKKY